MINQPGFVQFNEPTRYKLNTCTFMFMNKTIGTLKLNGIKNTFVENNQLSFVDLKDNGKPVNLNSKIRVLELEIRGEEIYDNNYRYSER